TYIRIRKKFWLPLVTIALGAAFVVLTKGTCRPSHLCAVLAAAFLDFWMKRKLVFDALAAILSLIIIALLIEAYVRIIADDGMQFDLEMWKYARDVKQLSIDPLLA